MAKTLNPKQAAAKARRIELYNARCETHRVKMAQRDAAAADRRTKLVESAAEVAAREQAAREAEERHAAALVARQEAEAKFVADSLAGPQSFHLKRWLANRIPTFERVSKFMSIAKPIPAPAVKKAA